jgi:hypothetical protein
LSEQAQRLIPGIRLTGRGAVLGMLAVFGLGLLGASWLGWAVLAGASFVAGAAAAVLYVRPRDLLMVTIAPPLLFCVALVVVKAATATGNVALATVEGAAVTLAGVAPWLFTGTALSLAIAWARGLRECVRELREGLWPGRQPGPPADPGTPPSAMSPPASPRPTPATADVASRSLTPPARPVPGPAAQDAPPSAS